MIDATGTKSSPRTPFRFMVREVNRAFGKLYQPCSLSLILTRCLISAFTQLPNMPLITIEDVSMKQGKTHRPISIGISEATHLSRKHYPCLTLAWVRMTGSIISSNPSKWETRSLINVRVMLWRAASVNLFLGFVTSTCQELNRETHSKETVRTSRDSLFYLIVKSNFIWRINQCTNKRQLAVTVE